MGKKQLLNLKIRVYIKGRSLLGIEPVAPHQEVCHKYGKIKYLIGLSINGLYKIKTGYERLKDPVRKGHTATVNIITS